MGAMLDELLDLGRLQAGQRIELERGRVDLVALARQAVAAQRQAADGRAIELETAEDAVVGWWDGRRLGRVLDNLLSNALKYSRERDEVVVRIGPAAGQRTVELTVRDRGIGIPPDDLPHVFERFRRGGNVCGQVVGSGLGLASVRHIVEQHGGEVSIDSRLGVGTTVAVRLPVDWAEGEREAIDRDTRDRTRCCAVGAADPDEATCSGEETGRAGTPAVGEGAGEQGGADGWLDGRGDRAGGRRDRG